MKNFYGVLCAALFASTVVGGCASDASDSSQVGDSVTEGSQETAYIRSASDLERYLKTAVDSPFDRLPVAAKQRFIASLVFTSRGLASYEYVDLKAISAEDAAKILGLFHVTKFDSAASRRSGVEGFSPTGDLSPRDQFEGYVCKPSDGGCVERPGHICNASTCRQE